MTLSASKVLNNLFEKEFGLSGEDNSDHDELMMITKIKTMVILVVYRILRRPDFRVDFPAKDEVEDPNKEIIDISVEENLLEGPSDYSNDHLGLINGSDIPCSISSEASEHPISKRLSSKTALARDDTVST